MKFYTSVLQWGSKILYRGYDSGRRVVIKDEMSPSLFIPSKKTKTEWTSLYGQPLEEMKLGDIREAKEFVKNYKDVSNFEIHGMDSFNYQYITQNYPKTIDYDASWMTITSIDIETASEGGFPNIQTANEEILLIALVDRTTRTKTVFGTRPHNKKGDYTYNECANEMAMLKRFIEFWQANCPDIVTGWNTDTFDFPYLINRIMRVLNDDWAKKLSPFNLINERVIDIRGKDVQTYDIVGVTQLDYLNLYKKFTYSAQESYALGAIATIELGDSKIESPYDSFKEFYDGDWDLFVEYNVKDADLVMRLDDKMKLIDLVIGVAFLVKCNFKDVMGPVKTWDVFIYNHLAEKKIAIPPQTRKISGDFEGAWVKDVQVGMHGWTMSFDFASLYPNIIRQWNMSPETLDMKVQMTVEGMVNPKEGDLDMFGTAQASDLTIAANGVMFRKDKTGMLPELMTIMLDGRKIAKKEMLKLEQQYQDTHDASLKPKIAALNNKQMAYKILANSAYGAITNAGFRYFDLRIGEAVTLTGQASDRHVEKTLNRLMNKMLKTDDVDYVVAGDTDSIYLNVDGLVKGMPDAKATAYLDKLGEEVFQKAINNSIKTIYTQANCYTNVMAMKREAIASKALWTAKKQYAMLVHNSEGVSYDPPKLKVMGLALVKSSTPQKVRDKLKTGLRLMFDAGEKEVQAYVSKVDADIRTWKPEEIAFPRGCNDIDKYKLGDGSIPIHVRAALLWNKHTDPKKYERIQNKDKLRFLYMKMPNPIKQNVFGFPSSGTLPKELKLDAYIDWETMVEKTFLSPFRTLTDAAGWQLEHKATLDDFFA